MGLYSKIIKRVNSVVSYIVMAFIAVMAMLLIIQVASRFIFHNPVTWSDETVRYLFLWMVFLGSGICIQHGDLIGIEAVINRVPPKGKVVFKIISYLVQAVFILIVIIQGYKLVTLGSMQNSPVLPIQMSLVYSAIPLGMTIALANLADIMLKDFFGNREVQ